MVSLGKEFGAFIDVNGTAYTWGANGVGQLGVGDLRDKKEPTKVRALAPKNVTFVACGSDYVIALGNGAHQKPGKTKSSRHSSLEERSRKKKEESPRRTITTSDLKRSSYRTVQKESSRSQVRASHESISQSNFEEKVAIQDQLIRLLQSQLKIERRKNEELKAEIEDIMAESVSFKEQILTLKDMVKHSKLKTSLELQNEIAEKDSELAECREIISVSFSACLTSSYAI